MPIEKEGNIFFLRVAGAFGVRSTGPAPKACKEKTFGGIGTYQGEGGQIGIGGVCGGRSVGTEEQDTHAVAGFVQEGEFEAVDKSGIKICESELVEQHGDVADCIDVAVGIEVTVFKCVWSGRYRCLDSTGRYHRCGEWNDGTVAHLPGYRAWAF